jgi:prepilin-type N-terminal cleavage/methylation domain-containing protein
MQRLFSVRLRLVKLGMNADTRSEAACLHRRTKMFKAQHFGLLTRRTAGVRPPAFGRPPVRTARSGLSRSLSSQLSTCLSDFHRGFTLLELLVVMGIIAILMVLVAPAFTTIKSGTDATSAAYTIKGVLDTARTYAKANNTYTWVGFFEEDGSVPSASPTATSGNGRIVMSIVASKDGTKIYTPPLSGSPLDMDPTGTALSQIGKLVKIDNMHLRTFSNGTGAGDTFPTRPAVPGSFPDNAKIGDTSPPDSLRYFHYPPTGTEAAAQYKFRKMIQFNARGECRPQNDNYEMRTVIEIGFQPIHGTDVASVDVNKDCAVQLSGLGGSTKIYQR